jgi:nucleoside-diphosphate-sugar epimerase
VTGGAGRVGRAVSERLVRNGWEVRVIGVEMGVQIPGAEYSQCDITDYTHLREQMRGCQVVAHLAAIPNPRGVPGPEVFRINVAGTFNVFEAAAAEGVRRVVQASSINAMGCAWGTADVAPAYFPIDEAHPANTTDPYSFSKSAVEDIGAYYWRRDGISSVALRWPAVWNAKRIVELRQNFDQLKTLMDAFARLPVDEQGAQLAIARQQALDFRARRLMEDPTVALTIPSPPTEEWLWKSYMFDRFNFWAFIDDRDAAQSVEKGLTADYEGSHPLFVVNDHNYLGYDSQTLAGLFFPDVTEWKRPVQGSEALISIERASALIGYQPEYSMHSSGDQS